MITKVWRTDDIKNHLLAVQAGMKAGVPVSLVVDEDKRLTAYLQGCDAALKCLAERFGVILEESQATRRIQIGKFELKTWTREDIEHNLNVARMMMYGSAPLSQEQEVQLAVYHQGINKTLSFLAMSFGIKRFE